VQFFPVPFCHRPLKNAEIFRRRSSPSELSPPLRFLMPQQGRTQSHDSGFPFHPFFLNLPLLLPPKINREGIRSSNTPEFFPPWFSEIPSVAPDLERSVSLPKFNESHPLFDKVRPLFTFLRPPFTAPPVGLKGFLFRHPPFLQTARRFLAYGRQTPLKRPLSSPGRISLVP